MTKSDQMIIVNWLAETSIKAIREDTEIQAGEVEIHEFIQQCHGILEAHFK